MTADFTRSDVTLSNWRTSPYSAWSFQNVSEIVPSAPIRADRLAEQDLLTLGPLALLDVTTPSGKEMSLPDFLSFSQADRLVVMRKGRIVSEWAAPTCDPARPHIVFSVSKSLTGLLAGALWAEGLLSFDRLVIDYVPEARGSAYADATVQQLFDMELSLDFVEAYLDATGGFARYRRATGWNPADPADPAPDLKSFLCSIGKGGDAHGLRHAYRSPNTDMAGIVVERAGGARFADLMSTHLFRPLGLATDGMVTVDRCGAARAAGGISVTARDLARIGEMVRLQGAGLLPADWVGRLWTAGSPTTWKAGDQAALFENGSYRNYWYATGQRELAAIGIHGQWIWIDPVTETVIVKQSSQAQPVDAALDQAIIAMLRQIASAG